MFVLGIDGGGTKTAGVVADETGRVFMQAKTGRSNPNILSREQFEAAVGELISQLKEQDPTVYSRIGACFAGMAGVDESGKSEEAAVMLRRLLPDGALVTVRNDAVNALYSGTLGEPGIVQIAGTGSIAFGINEAGRSVRAGGWGYLFDDFGSGFYLGNEALRAVFKAFDGRGEETSLTGRCLAHFGVKTVPDIYNKVYGPVHPLSVIAPLSRIVTDEAAKGDAAAAGIIGQAAGEMALSIRSCHRQLFGSEHPTPVILSGGVFSKPELFTDHLKRLTASELPNAVFRRTQMAPVGGAVVAGLKAAGAAPEPNFARRFNETYQ